jgi:hypothetical protein
MAWRFLGRRGRRWHNWSHNVTAFPERVFHPKTLDDVVAIIHMARTEQKKIRVAGDSHSWSPLVPTDDYLVVTKEMKGVSVDLSDPEHPLVTVAPGTTIAELDEACRDNGLVFPTNVVPTAFAMAAVATTGCHGTGILQGTVSDLVEAVQLVDANGNMRTITARDGDDVLNAARLSLGVLGFIWRMTFRAVPAFHVRVHDDLRVDMESAIDHFEEWVTQHEYTQLEWWPFNRFMWVKHYDRTSETPKETFCRRCWTQLFQRVKLVLGRGLYGVMMLLPPLTPMLLRIMYRVSASNADTVLPLEWAIHYQAGLKIVRVTNAEVAFPIDAGFANVKHAWRFVVSKTREYQARGAYPFNVAMVARFVRGSSVPLSPAYGNGLMCFIEIMTFAETEEWVPFSSEVLGEWLKIRDARPHWAKEMRQFPPAALREAYGGDLRRFLEIRERLGVDPRNMFVNDFLEAVFFPTGGAS